MIIGGVRDFILRTTRHPIGFVGLNITTISGILLVVLLAAQLFGFAGNPYVGILTFGLLPGLFVLGLLMMPVSSWFYRRRLRKGGKAETLYPVYDLNSPSVRSRLMFIGVMTAINLTIVAVLAYRGLEFMDSVSFCGQTCHPIMKPEFTVYQTSPHSRVRCVDCHIGPGASWFVKSKLSGSRQVIKQTGGDLAATDRDAGPESAPLAGHLRGVPLAGEVPRRQDDGEDPLPGGRGEHPDQVGPPAEGRRGQPGVGFPAGYPLSHHQHASTIAPTRSGSSFPTSASSGRTDPSRNTRSPAWRRFRTPSRPDRSA